MHHPEHLTTPASVLNALVSFWTHESDTAERWSRGNGFFVAPGWVLSAHHVLFDKDGEPVRLWMRCTAEGNMKSHRVPRPMPHGDHDVALVQLPMPLPNASSLELDDSPRFEPGHRFVFTGSLGARPPGMDMPVVLTGEAGSEGHWTVRGTFEPGHSGSGVRHGSKLVGVAIRRVGQDTGHIVPVQAFRPWLDGLKIVILNRPRLPLDIRRRFADCFRSPGFVECLVREAEEALPEQIRNAIDDHPEGGKGLADACRGAVRRITCDLSRTMPPAAREHCTALKDGLLRAMGLALLLAVNPVALASPSRQDGVVTRVGASTDLTAMLTLLHECACHGWRYIGPIRAGEPNPGQHHRAGSANVIPLGERELGVGKGEKSAIVDMLLRWQLSEGAVVYEGTDLENREKVLRNYLVGEREKFERYGHFLLVPGNWQAQLRWALLDWLSGSFDLRPIALEAPPQNLFFVDEETLVASIGSFMFDLARIDLPQKFLRSTEP